MSRATHSPLFVTKELFETRYQGAEAIFVAGSVVRGEAGNFSDLDLVVIYPRLSSAYRESFYHRAWPVEAFIHDPETALYFFERIDRPIGRATLAEMIIEGHEVPGPTPVTQHLKEMANRVLGDGPPELDDESLQDRRYHISELVDDLREPRSRPELIASAAALYQELSDYHFRVRRGWGAGGKAIVKRMKKLDPTFARRFADAFDALFASGQTGGVIELAEEMIKDQGGFLFEGYRRSVPSEWRIKRP